ncbi:MAG: ComF family protein [bacterium]
MGWAWELWEGFLELFFPPPAACPICGEILPAGGEIPCRTCRSRVRRVEDPFCPRCARPLAVAGNCPGCRGKGLPFRQARAAGIYEGALRTALHRFKYQGDTSLLPYLQQLLRECLAMHPLPEVDLVVPVPLHRSKEWERGFNQAALLAQGVARHLQKPVDYHSLVRKFPTPPTSSLSRRQREKILRGAFAARDRRLKGKTLLLVDDIFTTGSTAAGCAAALLEGGAEAVYVVTVAVVNQVYQ